MAAIAALVLVMGLATSVAGGYVAEHAYKKSKHGKCKIQNYHHEVVRTFGARCVKHSAMRQIDPPILSESIGEVYRNRNNKREGRNYAKAWKIPSRDEYRKPGRKNDD